MRERKPKNISSRPQRNRKDINYIDLCDDNTDPPPAQNVRNRQFNSLKERSASRIAAQSKITENKLGRSVDLPDQPDVTDPNVVNDDTPPQELEPVGENQDVPKPSSKSTTQKLKPQP